MMPWAMFSASMKPDTRWSMSPASPAWGLVLGFWGLNLGLGLGFGGEGWGWGLGFGCVCLRALLSWFVPKRQGVDGAWEGLPGAPRKPFLDCPKPDPAPPSPLNRAL